MPYVVSVLYFQQYNSGGDDRMWYDKGGTTWDPNTPFPGKDAAPKFTGTIIGSGTLTDQQQSGLIRDLELSNPPDDDHPSSYSAYFWSDDDDSLNSYSTPNYGFTVSLTADKTFSVDYVAPGNVMPNNMGTKNIVVGSVIPDGSTLCIFVCDMITAKIQNLTDAPLPYAVNAITTQPIPLTLSDFPASNIKADAIPKQKIVNVPLYNVIGGAVPGTGYSGKGNWELVPANIGLYFYTNTSTGTDPASAGVTIDTMGNVATPVNGTLKIDTAPQPVQSKNDYMAARTIIFTVSGSQDSQEDPDEEPDEEPDDTTTDSDKKSTRIWLWVGIAIIVLALIVVVVLTMKHHSSSTTYTPPPYKSS